jgi:hypothetical protein
MNIDKKMSIINMAKQLLKCFFKRKLLRTWFRLIAFLCLTTVVIVLIQPSFAIDASSESSVIGKGIDGTLLHSTKIEPNHHVSFYEFDKGDVWISESFTIGSDNVPILNRFEESSNSVVELFQQIQPNSVVPKSLVEADRRSKTASEENQSFSRTSQNAPQPLLLQNSINTPIQLAGEWQSWEGDARWFMEGYCNRGNMQICYTNVNSATSNGEQVGRNFIIYGMAAGFDTQAHLVIQSERCSGNILGLTRYGCRMRNIVDVVVQPREVSGWTMLSHRRRAARIDPISGDRRVHMATTWDSDNPPGLSPYQEYRFCVGSVYIPYSTQSVWARNYDEAENILRSQLPASSAGESVRIGRGACSNS